MESTEQSVGGLNNFPFKIRDFGLTGAGCVCSTVLLVFTTLVFYFAHFLESGIIFALTPHLHACGWLAGWLDLFSWRFELLNFPL